MLHEIKVVNVKMTLYNVSIIRANLDGLGFVFLGFLKSAFLRSANILLIDLGVLGLCEC